MVKMASRLGMVLRWCLIFWANLRLTVLTKVVLTHKKSVYWSKGQVWGTTRSYDSAPYPDHAWLRRRPTKD